MQWVTRLPESLQHKPVAAIGKVAGKVLLLVLLPFVLLSGLNQYFAEADLNDRIANERHAMAKILSDVSAQAEPAKRFAHAFSSLTTLPWPSEAFDRRLKQNFADNPGSIEVFFYDTAGKCLAAPLMPAPPRYVAQKFLEAVIDPGLGKKYERFIFQFSGYRSAHVAFNGNPDEIISIGSSHDRHWGGWFRLKDSEGKFSGHLIVFIGKRLLKPDKLLDDAISSAIDKFGRSYRFGWQNPVQKNLIMPENSGFASAATALVNAMPWGESGFLFDRCPGIKLFTDSGATILARTAYAVEPSMLFTTIGFTIKLLSMLTFLLLSYLLLGISSVSPGLRVRLAALFLYGAGIPLILLVFSGIADRIEREKVLIDGLQQQSVAELTRIDEGMTYEYRRLEGLFKAAIKKSAEVPFSEFRASLAGIGRLMPAFSESLREILVVAKDFSLTYNSENPQGTTGSKKEGMIHYGEMLLETFNGESVDKKNKPASTDLKSVVSDFGSWLARGLIMGSGRIGMLNILDSVMPTYVDVFVDKLNQARAVTLIFLSQAGVQRNYLLQVSRLCDRLKGDDQPRFAALPIDSTPVWPAFPKRLTGNDRALREIADQVVRSGLPVREIAEVAGRKYLLCAVKGKYIDGYVLIQAYPYRIIELSISRLNKRMLILSIMVILLALVSARITSSLLLKPLENLKAGLNAVSTGNFRMQVEGAAVEEFSLMLSSLNRTLGNFQEMQVARSVQETLWPEETLRGDDWQLYGRCRTATELGGDHFDWFRLKDGRVLLVVGDVTGHGIAPAMVQASIKVWLSLLAEKVESAASLLQEINRLHFKYGAKRLYMTCWLGFYTPAQGQLEFASAGHPYPLILRSNGEQEFLEQPGLPLGVKSKLIVGSGSRVINPGDSLILYTDGIVEATSATGKMLGFDGFQKVCEKTVAMEPSETVDFIIAQANAWGPQNDDQTVIVLKRYFSGDADEIN
ncbi:MAG: SpoIIE family protein phosphatase [Candidatus Riflebacteria bacterium]|nr:SpoIIE family protein phosphatase [Candidatus Riflebacteria bacterium]